MRDSEKAIKQLLSSKHTNTSLHEKRTRKTARAFTRLCLQLRFHSRLYYKRGCNLCVHCVVLRFTAMCVRVQKRNETQSFFDSTNAFVNAAILNAVLISRAEKLSK